MAAATYPAHVTAATGPSRGRWGAGRIFTLVCAVVAFLAGVGLCVAGTTVALVGHATRDGQGFYTTPAQALSTGGYALTSDAVHLETTPAARRLPGSLIGPVRITARGAQGRPVFIGVARTGDVAGYLAGVPHSAVTGLGAAAGPTYRDSVGVRRPVPPAAAGIWAARTAPGGRSLTWLPQGGDWTVVVMNPDGSAPVAAVVTVGATLPVVERFVAGALVAGALLLLLGLGLLVGALLTRPAAAPGAPTPTAPPPTAHS